MTSLHPNPMCDKGNCTTPIGSVRKLPMPDDANLLLCLNCFIEEIRWRRERNREIGAQVYAVPDWKDLEPYKEGE